MCVIFFSFNQRTDFPFVMAANRDEFYDRPTAPAGRWKDYPYIYGGRDLVSKGTWLGITETGRIAAVTNYRDMTQPKGTRSRGDLAADFLKSETPVAEYMNEIASRKHEYTGFSLLAGEINSTANDLFYYSNRVAEPLELETGLYGLSNHLLDTPWPKVVKGKKAFGNILAVGEPEKESMFDMLSDQRPAPDEDLPDTGVGLERERILSPIFIKTPIYGTRCSTIVTIDGELKPVLDERVFR